ncbi:hypothetical protein TNIN_387261 [Trichonephila inaurata madagascariensis]|uniref:Uncharacterized protein n=1 Tax=Trichonephila inaurata madagascariensis TaxID=2747483 RepID=A0A8X6JIB2_9ARAC|nr:hypothetical protein TNIN_387261 [Trichonephila inaurata madagascariensis]
MVKGNPPSMVDRGKKLIRRYKIWRIRRMRKDLPFLLKCVCPAGGSAYREEDVWPCRWGLFREISLFTWCSEVAPLLPGPFPLRAFPSAPCPLNPTKCRSWPFGR